MAFTIEVIIEIPKGSNVKYEMENGKLYVDRIMFKDFKYPQNYGFIEKTLDWDGDPLDVLVIANATILPNTTVKAKVVGAMKMIDEGETDTKLLAYVEDDPSTKNINSLDDIDKSVLEEIKVFFTTYKNYKGSKVEVTGFEDEKYAKTELEETKILFEKYKDMPKDAFIKEMSKKHPEKYKK